MDILVFAAIILAPVIFIVGGMFISTDANVCGRHHSVCASYWGSYNGAQSANMACAPIELLTPPISKAPETQSSGFRYSGSW